MSGFHRWWARVLAAAAAGVALFLVVAVGSVFAQDDAAVVELQGVSFMPAEIHVSPGTTVVWTNSSDFIHTVTADDGSFDSGNLDPGQPFMTTFGGPGAYTYYCMPHKAIGMLGVVVVDDPNAQVNPED